MTSGRAFGGGLLALALTVAGCGGGGSGSGERAEAEVRDVLVEAEQRLAALRSGVLSLRMAATAGAAEPPEPVGFALRGAFSFPAGGAGGTLPELDLTVTRLLGATEAVTAMRSTGDAVFVTADGATYRLADEQTAPLRRGTDAGLGELGVADWFVSPTIVAGEPLDGVPTQRVVGDLDLVAMLSDLAAVDARLGGGTGLVALEGEAAERLRRLARSGRVEMSVGTDDRLPRRLTAHAELEGQVPPELQEALGRLARARLDVGFELSEPNREVVVDPPPNAVPLPASGNPGR